jgi:hypothetical protein
MRGVMIARVRLRSLYPFRGISVFFVLYSEGIKYLLCISARFAEAEATFPRFVASKEMIIFETSNSVASYVAENESILVLIASNNSTGLLVVFG